MDIQIEGWTDRQKNIQWDLVLDRQMGRQTNIKMNRLAEKYKDWLNNAWKDRQMDNQKDKYSN